MTQLFFIADDEDDVALHIILPVVVCFLLLVCLCVLITVYSCKKKRYLIFFTQYQGIDCILYCNFELENLNWRKMNAKFRTTGVLTFKYGIACFAEKLRNTMWYINKKTQIRKRSQKKSVCTIAKKMLK